jgi:tetratricopeptide (TPR) repeat protein
MADIFVSYTSSDRDWAFWIANELRVLGHAPHVHEWEIRSGEDIYAWMEQRHDTADHVLCVVSDAYLKAPYSTLERNAALWQAVAKRPGFVLLVAVKPCRLPTLADHLRRCELYNIPEDEARRRFHEFMAKREAPTTLVFPGQYAVSNIPIRMPTHFLGRDDALAEIETALRRYEGRVAITALHGLRGVGKTTLAAAYADRHRSDYRVTWWIRAQTESTMRADLVGLGVRLKWIAADEKEEPALTNVMERLRQEGEGILLTYDNAVDANALRPYLPRGGRAHVLVTSNAHAWRGVAEPVEIRLWPKDIGADYLIARTGRHGEREAALGLSDALGGLPLAHEQAAAYCERLDISLGEYRRRFEATPARLLDDARHAPTEYHDGLTVAKTFALAIEEAAKLHPAAEPLIVHAALLAPEPIPLFLFAEARKKFGEPFATALEGDGLDEAVAALRTFALVDRESIADEREPTIRTDTIRLHRLVRQVSAARCDEEALEAARRVLVEAAAAVYPIEVLDDPRRWVRARRLDALALGLVSASTPPPKGGNDGAILLLDGCALYRHHVLAAYAEAQPLYERALAIREQVRGPEHPETAINLGRLARLRRDQGDFDGAQLLYERALAIQEKVLGPEHPDTATALNNLALQFQARGELEMARPLLERALAIREKVQGPDHPETAMTLNNFALLLWGQGDLAGARPLYERALAINEKVRGPEHLDTVLTISNLALVLKYQGNFDDAQLLYERALAIQEKVLGPEHPDTARTINNLAALLHAKGELAEARPLFERALATRERVLGHEHPDIGQSLNNLANLLRDQNKLGEAKTLLDRALTIWEKTVGQAHPSTALGLGNLATVLRAQGDFAGARPLVERALAINEKVSGPDHPNTAADLSGLARLLVDSGQHADAEPLFLRAIAIGDRALGAEHPLTRRYQSHYACLLLITGRPEQALKLGQAALASHARSRPNHPWTKDSARVTADALDALGRADEANALRARYDLSKN